MVSRRSLLTGVLPLAAPMINRGRHSLFAQSPEYSSRTLDLVRSSTVIDMLGLLTLNYQKLGNWEKDPTRFEPNDLRRLKESGITIFHPAVGFVSGDIHAASLRDISGWNSFLKSQPQEFLRISRVSDFARAKWLGKIGILIGQQNSAHFRSVADVDHFYDLGQRVSQLTYHANRIGGGSSDAHDTGLSQYGLEIVGRMNEVGMAVDISHCGDRTTMDAIDASTKPVLVTHSNCRALVPGAARCKTDEAIKRMAAKGGVMGITMVRTFVRAGGRTTMEHVLDHIDHLSNLVGVEHVGVGSDVDLDGRDARVRPARRFDLDGIDYSKKIFDLTEGLLARNYTNQNIQMILGGNFERALSAAWTS